MKLSRDEHEAVGWCSTNFSFLLNYSKNQQLAQFLHSHTYLSIWLPNIRTMGIVCPSLLLGTCKNKRFKGSRSTQKKKKEKHLREELWSEFAILTWACSGRARGKEIASRLVISAGTVHKRPTVGRRIPWANNPGCIICALKHLAHAFQYEHHLDECVHLLCHADEWQLGSEQPGQLESCTYPW